MPQRLLAMELRYRIDVAMQAERREVAPVSMHERLVRELIDDHPRGMASAHVRHNIGPDRLAWLKQKGMIDEA